jgi:hypothetical protein
MGNNDPRPISFRQSPLDFPCTVDLGRQIPSWELSRWRGCGLRFRPPDDEGFALRGDNRRLLYKGQRRSHRFTILGDNSFEYDCILNREPDSNIVTLVLDGAERFDFFRQPDFIKDPLLAGSYAVYKKETLIGEGTGKLCHIHRPKIIDARGRWVWGDLSIVGSSLCITIPENWLSEAAYPVIVDPVIGTTTIGSQTLWDYDPPEPWAPLTLEGELAFNEFTVAQAINGLCTAYFYAYSNEEPDSGGYPVIYDDNGFQPVHRLTKEEHFLDLEVAPSKPSGWRSTTFETKGTIAAGSKIWFGFYTEYFAYARFDYGGKFYSEWNDVFDSIPETLPVYTYWSGSADDYYSFKISWYFNYTSAQNYTRTLTQGVTLTDNRKLIANYKRTAVMNGRTTTALGHGSQYFRQHSTGFAGLDTLCFERGFLRTIAEQIRILNPLGYCRDFLRQIVNTAKSFTAESRSLANKRDIASMAGSGDSVVWGRGFFRTVATLLHPADTAAPFAGWLRHLTGEASAFDTAAHGGSYIRGLYVEAGNIAETKHQGAYFRKHEDTVLVEALSLRHLIIFIKLVTAGFVRDFIIRRFLKSNEDIVLKSYVCRKIEIDSRIH